MLCAAQEQLLKPLFGRDLRDASASVKLPEQMPIPHAYHSSTRDENYKTVRVFQRTC